MRARLKKCEESLSNATEVPILLTLDRIVFRAKARLGDLEGAKDSFKIHVQRLKKIAGNMPSRELAESFLGDSNEQLLFREHRLVSK
jgi:hypothetical protein